MASIYDNPNQIATSQHHNQQSKCWGAGVKTVKAKNQSNHQHPVTYDHIHIVKQNTCLINLGQPVDNREFNSILLGINIV